MDDKTEELLEGGWLHSGDAGYIDENGHLVVIDRVADVMHNSRDEMFSKALAAISSGSPIPTVLVPDMTTPLPGDEALSNMLLGVV